MLCVLHELREHSPANSFKSKDAYIESDGDKGNEIGRFSRSVAEVLDWSKCLFCKNKTYKKSKELINVCTFEASNSIRKAAEAKGDESMLHVLRSTRYDLIASEAKYHKSCYSLYLLKKDPKIEDQQISLYEVSFQEFAAEITRGIREGKAYDMASLLAMYQDILKTKGVDASSYTKQHLKARLQKHFGDDLVFHPPTARNKPELVYGSTIMVQDILNAWAELQRKKDEECIESEIFRVAKHIKKNISEVRGISTKPLNVSDVSLASTQRLIPDSLHLLLRLLVTSDITKETQLSGCNTECNNANEERQVLSIAQDIIYCCSNSRVKLPKQVCLAMCVHHLTASKGLITLLNRMGHCCSYDDFRAVDTSIAMEVLAKAQEYGTVIPTNISQGLFVQLAADNNDINEETLDGKNATHATTMVVYQKKQFGPEPPPKPLAQHRTRRRSLQTGKSVIDLEECSVYGKRPTVAEYVGQVDKEWFSGESDAFNCATSNDVTWKVLRLNNRCLSQALVFEASENQSIPSWSGFNSILFPDIPCANSIGYCPLIEGSSTEFSTIYTVLKHAQAISASVEQADTVITFDLAIYIKAKQLQWRFPDEFSDVVIRVGGFHIAINFLSLLGKKYASSGLHDLLVESGVYGAGAALTLMKGKAYNRGVRAHKLTMEAFFRLMWRSFPEWCQSNNNEVIDRQRNHLFQKIQECIAAVEKKEDVSKSIRQLETDFTEVTELLEEYKTTRRTASKMFAFWEEYLSMVDILLQFIKAERTADWGLHLTTVAVMLPHFFAMDRQNYARWLPIYLADMNNLAEAHPRVYREFQSGGHAVCRSSHPFAQVWTDMALEQSINADCKTKGGIIGISQSPAALNRWFLTAHERAYITSALKQIYGLQCNEQGVHKEAATKRVKRDEEDVQKLLSCFSTGLMTDPFSQDTTDLMNFATSVVLPGDLADALVRCTKKGKEHMSTFIEKRINTNAISFWDPITKHKVKTFETTSKKVQLKAADGRLITVKADRDLFGRLLIVANARQINLREVLSYELSPVPCSLVHNDGNLRKAIKSDLASVLEDGINAQTRLPVSQDGVVHIVDGMALIQMHKSTGASTFGELASKYFTIVVGQLSNNNCSAVHLVFDQYWATSIKAGERSRRGSSDALEVRITGPNTPVPKQWAKYIQNPKNKINLCDFLTSSLCKIGQERLTQGKRLIIGGGFTDGERAVGITRARPTEDINALKSNHEEADTRMILHAAYAVRESPTSVIIIQSPDTDVFVLCVSHFTGIGCRELWFRTGVSDRQRYIPVHTIQQSLGERLCQSLPAFHALTGCDSTSSISRRGKKKPWIALKRSAAHQTTLNLFGQQQDLDETLAGKTEAFIRDLYPKTRRSTSTMDELRYLMFCQQRKRKNEVLPPTSDSLRQHLKRASYQTFIWRSSLVAMQDLQSPEGHGWHVEDGLLKPVYMTKDPAPRSLIELTTCNCKKSQCQGNCTCYNSGLSCTEACLCMADETCNNPHSAAVQYLSDSEQESGDDFEEDSDDRDED